MNVNYLKAGIAATALICVTILLAFGRIDDAAGFGLIGTIVGYATGNGIAAKHGENVEPIIGTARRDRRATDHLEEEPDVP